MNPFSRRHFLQGAATIAGALSIPPFISSCAAQTKAASGALAELTPQQAAQIARGVVFLDVNNSGRRAPDSKGVAGVRVSNGREVVVTDAQGRYQLPIGEAGVVFVVKPSGHRVPLNAHNLPRHFYLHRPQGSLQGAKYDGIAPTGALPTSIDFPLIPQNETDDFRVLLFGDPQPRNLKEVDYVARDVVADLVGVEAAFGLSLGDNAFNRLEVLEPLNEVTAQIGLPWHAVVGNHDLNLDAPGHAHSRETFQRIYGPTYYSFDYGPVHFIVSDNVQYLGNGKGYIGAWGARQLEWLANDLKSVPRDKLVVVSMHIPLVMLEEERGAGKPDEAGNANEGGRFNVAERARFLRILSGHAHTMSISAHTHVQYHAYLGREAGWTGAGAHHHYNCGTVSGSWWSGAPDEQGIPNTLMRDGTPNGFAFLNCKGADYDLEWRVARRAADYQMNVYAPARLTPKSERAVEVNVFNGSPQTKVEMRLNGGAWQTVPRAPGRDPGYMALKAIEEGLPAFEPGGVKAPWRPLPGKYNTSHLWKAELPADLKAGANVVEVRARDPWNRTFSQRRIVRVGASEAADADEA